MYYITLLYNYFMSGDVYFLVIFQILNVMICYLVTNMLLWV